MKIPPGFTAYMNGNLPKKVSLRDRFGNMWSIGVTRKGRDIYFQSGWEKFVEENIVVFGDFFIFDYDGNKTFDFKLLGVNKCEKKGAGGLKLVVKEEEAEEMIVEHQQSAEPKGKTWACDSSRSSSDDEDYSEDEEYEDTEKDDDDDDSDNDNDEETEEEGENKRPGTFDKKASRSKAGCKRATACNVSDIPDSFGAEIFRSGRATQPKNPYFVETIRQNRSTDRLYVPVHVVRDFKLELPSSMIIRDSAGRKFKTEVHHWADGRIWLSGRGWGSLCQENFVEKNDKCICEFVRGEGDKGLYIQVQILHEIESSHPNQKNKK